MSNINYKELLEDCRGEMEVFGRPQTINSKLLMESVEELQQRIAELEAQVPKWISVEDRLPEKRKNNDLSLPVLVYNEYDKCEYTAVYDYINRNWFCFLSYEILHDGISHWMSLPRTPVE